MNQDAHEHTYTHTHKRTHYAHTHTNTHIHTQTHIHTPIHTHTRIHTQGSSQQSNGHSGNYGTHSEKSVARAFLAQLHLDTDFPELRHSMRLHETG